ncbi:heat-inducible transcription repressor HrcA [Desulfofarcimen acetoxidans DSM 771]|uniref:Heat-inducible transcription repressor HrcA n=1 Tax=Desulfofarcimen acetoxidans (strain ATCC 49208 / DSM 771 / KCTC 5769 / VKM B-1644 / 5575) TaxID=485916 RepID=C8W4S8_DESAS|nr:heat-inducible transcriptional repressor HrcA [Desulfofarcimen acetoxidans]ACV63964.1 heat-inducible transcription repressor HrcA [Desulfofarcimen acetoxidans DSM 771]
MKMDERKQRILMAIIRDYILTAEPVGSRTIARKYKLGVSPATIRNEMTDLEDMGLIEQPHTSSGRIPSDLGYRYYVDYLMENEKMSEEAEQLVLDEYDKKVKDVGQVIQRTGQLLTQLTNYTSLVLIPSVSVSSFKYIQLVLMSPTQAMVLVVLDTGTVNHRMIEVAENIKQSDLDIISKVLNAKLQGKNMESIKLSLIRDIYMELSVHKQVLNLAMELMEQSLTVEKKDKIYLGGVFNILDQPEFQNIDKVKTLLSLLEQEQLLCDLMSDVSNEGVTVRIGGEINKDEIKGCSMVTSGYQMGGKMMGRIGIIGPTRMEYARTVSVVEFLTRSLSDALERMLRGG